VIVAVPAAAPYIMPDKEPAVATEGLLLAQMPPAVVSVNVVDRPEQILVVVVVIGNIELVTETVVVTGQPVLAAVNVITDEPTLTPI
jgi:hypothetical protein